MKSALARAERGENYAELAEQSVLGGLLLDNQSWDRIADLITAEDFYRREHRLIFNAASVLRERNIPADVITVSEWLERSGELEAAGGLAYIGSLANNTPGASNIVAYAAIVREAAARLELTRTLEDSLKSVRGGGAIGELTSAVVDRLQNISEHLAPGHRSVLLRVADVEPENIRWLWRGRIALGKLSLLVGDPGLGKSFVTLDMAARLSTGSPWPDGAMAPRGSVLILSAEDDPADTIRPRLDALDADPSRIHILQAVRDSSGSGAVVERMPRLNDLPVLAEAIERVGDVKLLIIDPIAAYLGSDVDSHKNSDIRALLAPLAAIAGRYGIAIVGVSHLNKSQGGAIYRTMGSLAFTAAARAVWCVTKDPQDEHRRLVLPIKNNIGPDQGGLAYQIEDDRGQARIVWERDPVHANVNDILASTPVTEDRTERGEAAEWLRGLLADGSLSAKDVERQAKQAGFSWATIRRAKDVLGIKPAKTRFDGGWEWTLSKKLNPTSPKNVSAFDGGEHLREIPEENRHSESAQASEDVEDAQGAQRGQVEQLRDEEVF